MTAKKSTKKGRILEGGGEYFSGLPEYIPLSSIQKFAYDQEKKEERTLSTKLKSKF